MEFVRNNLLLIAVAVISGVMLIWPLLRRGAGGPWVDPAQATHLINREDALVIDVREPAEYATGHIINAKNVPLAGMEGRGDVAKRKDRPLIVYCDTGNRASKAAAAFRGKGFSRVLTLSGGIGAWQQAGLPVEK